MIGDRDGIVALAAPLVLDIERNAKMRQDGLARGLGRAQREFEQCGVRGKVHGEGVRAGGSAGYDRTPGGRERRTRRGADARQYLALLFG